MMSVVMTKSKLVKVQFYDPDIGYENIWAADLGGGRFRLENIPFFIYGLALNDIVLALPGDDEGVFEFVNVIERSGSRTLRARSDEFIGHPQFMKVVVEELERLGCKVEKHRSRLLAIRVPAELDLSKITDYLTRARLSWEYGHPQDLNN